MKRSPVISVEWATPRGRWDLGRRLAVWRRRRSVRHGPLPEGTAIWTDELGFHAITWDADDVKVYGTPEEPEPRGD